MAKGYRAAVDDIDAAIERYIASTTKPPKKTEYLVQHSRRPELWAPVKPVMWVRGPEDASYEKAGGTQALI